MKTYEKLETLPEIAEAIVEGVCERRYKSLGNFNWVPMSCRSEHIDKAGSIYRRVIELEEWEPKEGERVLVWDENEDCAKEKIFKCMVDGWHICTHIRGDNPTPVGWQHCKPVPKKNMSLESDACRLTLWEN